jgi:hypothetical protein
LCGSEYPAPGRQNLSLRSNSSRYTS